MDADRTALARAALTDPVAHAKLVQEDRRAGRLFVLALDLGDCTGWASNLRVKDERYSGPLCSGVRRLGIQPGEHPGSRWRRAREVFRELSRGHGVIAWEKIIAGGFGQGGFAKSTLFGLETQLVEVAAELGIETLTVAPMTLKKFAAGTGKATKAELRALAGTRWPGVSFETHDEVDARWIFEWAVKNCGHLPAAAVLR